MKAYKEKVKELPPKLTREMSERGKEIAQETAIFMDAYDSGELVRGIISEQRDDKGYVVSTAYHSAFVEMGTGVRGQENPNPYDYLPGWQYDVNEHGESGWVYPGDDGKLHWTAGMPHRPFMYETGQRLREIAPEVARELMQEGEGKK